MKKLILFFVFVFFILSARSQDIIVFNDANEIEVKVTDITDKTISYVKWNNPDGPKYMVNKSDVFYVKYSNGEKEVFKNNKKQSNNINIRLQSYIYDSAIFTPDAGGPAIDLSLGMRLWDYGYIGVETGFHSLLQRIDYSYDYEYYEYNSTLAYIPVGINLKGYIPTEKEIYPYVNCSLGGFFGFMDLNRYNGFYCQAGVGIDVKRFSFGIGYNGFVNYHFINKNHTISCGYVKLGARFTASNRNRNTFRSVRR